MIKFTPIPHHPNQFTSRSAAYPVAADRGIFSGGFAQKFFNGDEAILGDDGLPGVIADAVGKGIKHTPCAGECFFLALADKGDHHETGMYPFDLLDSGY